ncbi:hypothetical protein [Nocardioides sp.]|uniref:LysM peptidoglycan-binding domain-containing protein n=1 Tax=Nocardioides sp. TaxID=35761 RepID=UPI0031FE879F|nr:LysM protein [Nocardioides sp.]
MNDTLRPPTGRLRCLLVWLVGTLALVALLLALRPELDAARSDLPANDLAGQPFDQLLVRTCAAVAALAAGWLWMLTTLVVLEALGTTQRERSPGVPDVVRRVVLLACGVAVAGATSPALAGPGPVPLDSGGRSDHTSIRGLPLPDRATGGATLAWLAHVTVSARRVDDRSTSVVVRPGDNLWTIAAADLPPGADDAAVAAHSKRIYALNRDVIGPDPDLIRPNQRLEMPRNRR